MKRLSAEELADTSARTLSHYQQHAAEFWDGTRYHDVSQNVDAFLSELGGERRHILEFGCGPGRDVKEFMQRGHQVVGLDGCEAFVAMAKRHTGAPILHQDFLSLSLPQNHFDGIFANASLFHVPTQELPQVLEKLWRALKSEGVLFAVNPRGDDQEGYSDARYGAYHSKERWWAMLSAAGFEELSHYYRPPGLPREQQPWLASLWRAKKQEPSGTFEPST